MECITSSCIRPRHPCQMPLITNVQGFTFDNFGKVNREYIVERIIPAMHADVVPVHVEDTCRLFTDVRIKDDVLGLCTARNPSAMMKADMFMNELIRRVLLAAPEGFSVSYYRYRLD